MKQYVCKKKANFGGERYFENDVVPAEKIDPSRVKQLIDYGILTVVDAPDPVAEPPKDPPEQPDENAGEQQQEEATSEQTEQPDEQPATGEPVTPEESTDEADSKAADEKPVGKRGKK